MSEREIDLVRAATPCLDQIEGWLDAYDTAKGVGMKTRPVDDAENEYTRKLAENLRQALAAYGAARRERGTTPPPSKALS